MKRLLFSFVLSAFFSIGHLVALDHTHDASRKSWVESANDPASEFPIQNLPYGVFRRAQSQDKPRIGVAIGSSVFDLKAAIEGGYLNELSDACRTALSAGRLNEFMALGKNEWTQVRQAISKILARGEHELEDVIRLDSKLLIPLQKVEMLMPADIGDYTDFYASLHHATNIGSFLRPGNPLMPNYKHMPIGYHGRASSIVVSGTTIHWPKGQILNQQGLPQFGFSNNLDYELEMGIFIGTGNPLGSPVDISEANNHIFGFVLVNDWSARDIQKWEYQPLGPFNSKNFSTSISPWIVTAEALAPFRTKPQERQEEDPPLLEYLQNTENSAYDIVVEAYFDSAGMRLNSVPPLLITRSNLSYLYWTFDQMLCQHTLTGCNLRPGDLLASGTVSGPSKSALACLFERIALNMEPLSLPDGTNRRYLESGDEVILRAYATKAGYARVGFGECRGIVVK